MFRLMTECVQSRVARAIQRCFIQIGLAPLGPIQLKESCMKIFSTIAIAGAMTLSLSSAEQLTINQAPSTVQNTINRQRGKDQIKKIQRKEENGKTVYEVEFYE